eukprot:1109512-Amphidinium_carterae.1
MDTRLCCSYRKSSHLLTRPVSWQKLHMQMNGWQCERNDCKVQHRTGNIKTKTEIETATTAAATSANNNNNNNNNNTNTKYVTQSKPFT